MNVLITGSSGFLGSNAVRHFQALGHQVTGVDIVAAPTTTHVETIQQYIANNPVHFDLLLHFAADVGGRANIENNYLSMMANIELDRAVFDWAIKHVDHMVYPSSSAVYPVTHQLEPGIALSESMIDFETNQIGVSDHLYGWCKLSAERMLWQIHQATDMRIHIVRPFSGYGPAQSLAYPMANLVNIVKTQPDNLQVWGTGNQTRDWVHITDILRTLEWCASSAEKYTTLNIGTGVATSFNDLVTQLYQAVYASDPPRIQTRPELPTGVNYRTADTTKQRSLGIVPQVSLAAGIQTLL